MLNIQSEIELNKFTIEQLTDIQINITQSVSDLKNNHNNLIKELNKGLTTLEKVIKQKQGE